jgi:hypothetical protein
MGTVGKTGLISAGEGKRSEWAPSCSGTTKAQPHPTLQRFANRL